MWLRRLLIELGFVIPHVARVTTQEEAEEGEIKKLQKIGIQLTPPILCDNKGTVFTANNPSTDVNNKALETRWYNVRDYVQNGLLRIFHIGTNLNVADFFTKALTGEKFNGFRDFLMGDFVRKDSTLNYMSSYFIRTTSRFAERPGRNPAVRRAF